MTQDKQGQSPSACFLKFALLDECTPLRDSTYSSAARRAPRPAYKRKHPKARGVDPP